MTDADLLEIAPGTAAEVELLADRAATEGWNRMCRGDAPVEPVERIFGVTTFEPG
ncbi:MAG TPA: hypothetical protein VFV72_17395 [Candidatus Limnocylindrales bacterium]|nr:hypothetical protein [Candidatus Limnocylindrales bacterium]